MPDTTPQFGTDEPLWFCNGKWGDAGYAIPNPGGKTWTVNESIFDLYGLIGRNMFEMLHEEDVKFYAPPGKQFWYTLHQMLIVARKRLADEQQAPNDSNGLRSIHAQPTTRMFIVYPIPYFGERIRQPDIRRYAGLGLMLLTELMQHSDNERETHITTSFAGTVGKYLQEILALMAMKYFNKTRAEAYAPDFKLADADFQKYDPAAVMTSVEMTEERPPRQWWPTENDLSGIKAMPINEALVFAKRWPMTDWLDAGDPSVFPGLPKRDAATPGDLTAAALAGGGVGTAGGGSTVAAPVGFTPPPGQAP